VAVAEVGASVAGEASVAAGVCTTGTCVEVGTVCCGPVARRIATNAAATASVSIAVLFLDFTRIHGGLCVNSLKHYPYENIILKTPRPSVAEAGTI
jgi:hypothetical protein